MDPRFSRRALLAAGAGLALGAACGNGSGSKGSPPKFTNDPTSGFGIAPGSIVPVSGVDQRVVVGVLDKGKPVPAGTKITLQFGFDALPWRPGPQLVAQWHDDGIPTRPYALVHTRFDRAGPWLAVARAEGHTAAARLTINDPAGLKVPIAGRPLVSVPTPTVANPLGVNPICTRQPACPLHTVSLDAAIARHQPIAVLFATPALCESRTCGPVLEVLLSEAAAFRDRVQLIHVEIYTDLTGAKQLPAVTAFGLPGEPILFLAGADGVVRQVLDGPYDRAELRGALGAIAA